MKAVRSTPPVGRSLSGGPGTRDLEIHVLAAVLVGLATTIVWAAVGAPANFWPFYVWQSGRPHDLPARRRAPPRRAAGRPLALAGDAAGDLAIVCSLTLSIWLLPDGGGYFWPFWVAFGLAVALAIAGVVAYSRDDEQLAERVGALERTRRGALDVQAAELRRIERDLHDGAQARLVALTMQLGRAEARLDDHPEAAGAGAHRPRRGLRRDRRAARPGARDRARRCSPTAASSPPSRRSAGAPAIPVALYAELERAPAAGRRDRRLLRRRRGADQRRQARARRERATVRLAQRDGDLDVAVADDGPGGADRGRRQRPGRPAPARRGARRHADDQLSPSGGPTTITRGAAMRVVIAEDLALLREGLVALLREHEHRGRRAGRGRRRACCACVAGHKPDLAIVDVRMPPTFTDEGLRAALEAARAVPRARRSSSSPSTSSRSTPPSCCSRRRRRRLPAQGARRRRARVRRRRAARRRRRHGAGPRGRRAADARPRRRRAPASSTTSRRASARSSS